MKNIDNDVLATRALQVQRGGARAAVLGVNDGLVSTLCLVLAVAATGATAHAVLIAGLAGLVAGAVSMAAGEWISVKAQVELLQGVLHDLKGMVRHHKEILTKTLIDSYVSQGFSTATARIAAEDAAAKDNNLFRTYSSQVIGVNSEELGSPWIAAFSSFALFTIGALVPLVPWFFVSGNAAIWLSIIGTAIGGLFIGGYVAKSSGKKIMYGAVRQWLIIILAAGTTYSVGYVFGVSIS